MTNEIIIYENNSALNPDTRSVIDLAIAAWLDAKSSRTGSKKTRTAYTETIRDFRAVLDDKGLDLDSEPSAIALLAQAWAAYSVNGCVVSPSTYNQRLAVVSSFYNYAKKQGLLTGDNPINRVDRRPIQGYAKAAGVDVVGLKVSLAKIDRSTVEGKRDYALLSIALGTGRRVSELAALEWRDLLISGNQIIVTWRRCKGGKVMTDKLTAGASRVLLEYMHAVHSGAIGSLPPEQPIWISFSRRNPGGAISIQTIADICEKRLGTSKVHTLRHTFAKLMEDAGAKVSEIQAKLGHESLATTGHYLAALNKAENAYGDTIAAKLGLE